MIRVREAVEADVDAIRDIFLASYGDAYAHPEYYSDVLLKKLVYADDTILLVAEESEDGKVVGTASVILEIGANADLLGEFGRLAVHPDARRRGIGRQLMEGRLQRVEDRLHVAVVENRIAHPYSQKISIAHGFAPVGVLPLKLLMTRRESIGLFAHYFGQSLSLRRNNPRIIPEAHALSELAMHNCGLPYDAIVDDDSTAYPLETFQLRELTTQGYTNLLRIERGRVRHREIFGPLRLHYGWFRLRAYHSHYLLAYDDDELVGAIGFIVDEVEKAVRIFELVSINERCERFLLEQLIDKSAAQWQAEYIEVDVSAHAPRMQRTLLELGFQPAAYVPAMVFHEVERLDVIKMSRLLIAPEFGDVEFIPELQPIANRVMQSFTRHSVLPRVAEAIPGIPLFAGLNEEQIYCVAGLCDVTSYEPGQPILQERQQDGKIHILLAGRVAVTVGPDARHVAKLDPGQCLGEMSFFTNAPHSASAKAQSEVETAIISHAALNQLVRRRPDIGVVLYRNFATGIGEKLNRSDVRLTSLTP